MEKKTELLVNPEPAPQAEVDPKAETRVLAPTSVAVGKTAKKNCKHCYGRGYIGTVPTTGPGGVNGESRLLCRCLKYRK